MYNAKAAQVLHIDPARELVFTGPFTEVSNATITLRNPSDKLVCFKIKTTAPKLYCVRPNSENKQIMVMLQPLEKGVSIPEAGHKFMVQSCFAPHSDVDLENIWKNIEPSKLMSSKLFVTYEPARDNTEDQAARKDTAATIKYLWSPDIIPSTKTNDSGRSVSDLESELRSEVEQRKKVENEKNTLNKEIQELFKKNARLQEDFQRISMAEIGASPIQVIFATIAALLLGLIIGRLF